MSVDILIVDDEKDICNLVADILEDEGYECRIAYSGSQALEKVKDRMPSLVLQDIWLGESSFDGIKVLETMKSINADIPVVMMSGHGTIETAVSALKKGAYDFLEKPFNSTRLLVLVEKALENSRLKQENHELKKDQIPPEEMLLGSSEVAKTLRATIEKIAPTNSRVVIQGPNGVGKDTIAKLIHQQSSRKDRAFITLDCMGLGPEEFEKKLFGSESGDTLTPGLFERAHKGTILLQSINDMPLSTQARLVRALHSQKVIRQGGATEIPIDVRVISSTSIDLKRLVELDAFREDLYFRLNVVSLIVPPLKERKEDISVFANHFLEAFRNKNAEPLLLSTDATIALKSADWPGNIRQLRNFIELVAIPFLSSDKTDITQADLPALTDVNSLTDTDTSFTLSELVSLPLKQARDHFETAYLKAQMIRFENNISKVAEFIAMERSALHRKLKVLDIQKADPHQKAS